MEIKGDTLRGVADALRALKTALGAGSVDEISNAAHDAVSWIPSLSSALSPCPWCECEHINVRAGDAPHENSAQAWCVRGTCLAQGPWRSSEEAAVAAWNRVADIVAGSTESAPPDART